MLLLTCLAFCQCDWDKGPSERECTCRPWSAIEASDTLRVITYSSSTTAYQYKKKWCGYQYEQAARLADKMGMTLQLLTVAGEQEMLDSLRSGAADLAISPVAYSVARADSCVRPCGPRYEVGQALITARRLPITDQDSARFSLAVLSGSRQMLLLNEAREAKDSLPMWCEDLLLPAFAVDTLPADTFSVDLLVHSVLEGRWDACLVDVPQALLFKNYYPGIRVGNPLPDSEDSVAWMVSVKADTLAAIVDAMMPDVSAFPQYALSDKRHYEQSRGRKTHRRAVLGNGQLSVYDAYFRQYAHNIGWDWRMLAAIGFVESRFEPSAEHKGARGVMQLEARTASSFGYSADQIDDPDCNIAVAAQLLQYLENCLRSKIIKTRFPETREPGNEVTDEMREIASQDLLKFTLAAYNAGMGHVYDAIVLAETLGYDPAIWDHNVAHCLRLKAEPEFYNLSCVSLGKFNGGFTCNYVRRVLETYDDFKEQVQ